VSAADEKLTDERFRRQARAALACVDYQGIGEGGAADYARLAARIAEIERRADCAAIASCIWRCRRRPFPGTIEALGKGRAQSKQRLDRAS
jgi:hypothetical protein